MHKRFIYFFTLLMALSASAKKIKLNYEPKGKIIRFYFDSLTIYTDSTSLLALYNRDGTLKDYDLRVTSLVKKEFSNCLCDTITFSGNYIPFNDGTANKYQEDWYVEWAILHLTKQRKLKMYDKHGQLINTIVTKKVGKKRDNFVKRSYINKATNEELLKEV